MYPTIWLLEYHICSFTSLTNELSGELLTFNRQLGYATSSLCNSVLLSSKSFEVSKDDGDLLIAVKHPWFRGAEEIA